MKKLFNALSVLALSMLVVMTGCKKKEDTPTPDTAPNAKVYTVTMSPNSLTPSITANVSTTDSVAKIRLDVTSTTDIDQIFIMRSTDNGPLEAVMESSITTSDGKTFTGGSSSYTFQVPGSTRSFVLDVPVSIRTSSAAVTDVYYIWITNGSGSFTKPTKNTVLGPATVTLKYGSTTATPYTSATGVVLGDQTNSAGSLLVTSGLVSALNTADYIDAPQSADISLSALNSGGTAKTNNSGILWLVSPSERAGLGYAGCASCGTGGTAVAEPTTSTGANVTYIAPYTGSATFDNATSTDLANLSVGTNTKAQINGVNNVFMFQTAKGKKGLLKITSYNSTTATTGSSVTVSVKVQP